MSMVHKASLFDTAEKTEHLRQKLKQLEQLDKKRKIHGADWFYHGKQSGHEYRSIPAKEEELIALEQYFSITLPADYRDYLLRVGYGAGPGYGLLSPEQIIEYTERGISAHVDTELGVWFDEEDFNTYTGYGKIKYFQDLNKAHVKQFKHNLRSTDTTRSYPALRILSIEGARTVVRIVTSWSLRER